MISTVLGKFLLLALLFNRDEPTPAREYVPPMPVPREPPGPDPWPAAPPVDLPPFPSGWEYFTPTPPAVVTRAWALLNELWSRGEGATVQEQTSGVWVTYRAEVVAGGVKGVTAWRVKAGASAARPAAAVPSASVPVAFRPATPAPTPTRAVAPTPAARPVAPAAVPVSFTSAPAPAPLPAAPAPFVPFYAPPAGGMTVAQIQSALNAAGASPALVPDGQYGNLTRAAVVGFQHAHGLAEDGKAGPATQTALQSYLNQAIPVSAAPRPVQTPAAAAIPAKTPPAVVLSASQIQSALNAAGAMPPLVVDGQAGAKTKAATVTFQKAHGLSADGIAGPLTQAALLPYLGSQA